MCTRPPRLEGREITRVSVVAQASRTFSFGQGLLFSFQRGKGRGERDRLALFFPSFLLLVVLRYVGGLFLAHSMVLSGSMRESDLLSDLSPLLSEHQIRIAHTEALHFNHSLNQHSPPPPPLFFLLKSVIWYNFSHPISFQFRATY